MGEAPTTLQPEEDAPPTADRNQAGPVPTFTCVVMATCAHHLHVVAPVTLHCWACEPAVWGTPCPAGPGRPQQRGRREPDGKPPGSRRCRRPAGPSDFFSSAGKAPLVFSCYMRDALTGLRRGRWKQQKDGPGSLGDSLNLWLGIGPWTGGWAAPSLVMKQDERRERPQRHPGDPAL